METVKVPQSKTFREAAERFKEDVRNWACQCMQEENLDAVGDGHDPASYTTSWKLLTQDRECPQIMPFLKQFRDAIRNHFVETGAWHHGYWRKQEVHHGTEHTELFLGWLYRLDPHDPETRQQILDVAEHIGNWLDGIPPWFDWQNGLFRSMYLGTDTVGAEEGTLMNVADHLRLVNIALIAFDIYHDQRYLDLATEHAGQWADAVVKGNTLPAGILPNGPAYNLPDQAQAAYHGFAGMAGDLQDDVDRAENILASGGVNAFIKLWQLTRQQRFLHAATRILDVLATQLQDPDAGAAADVIRCYRRATGDTRYDAAVWQAARTAADRHVDELGVVPRKRAGRRLHGIGKRNDKPEWFEDGQKRRMQPILLALQAEIAHDVNLAMKAIDLAAATFALGRRALKGNRHHGCGASSDTAVARGHGRENGAGMVTAVLEPLLDIWDET